jgi:hypothetical protein
VIDETISDEYSPDNKWAIFQPYHGKNKLYFAEMIYGTEGEDNCNKYQFYSLVWPVLGLNPQFTTLKATRLTIQPSMQLKKGYEE